MLRFSKAIEICPKCKETKEDCTAQRRKFNKSEFGVNLVSHGHYHKCYKEIYSLETDNFTPSESLLGADYNDLLYEEAKDESEINKKYYDEEYIEHTESEYDSDSDNIPQVASQPPPKPKKKKKSQLSQNQEAFYEEVCYDGP
ncbi:unnamed protein product [Moneuplotes crassus]|uniref:Uncharacterized protein n=1 Tax=Euplotes crassus TaxID=5936 RepID=A0AAD1XJ01_EUPCR|nr:unnamed protein product [Moneuplotes crassus]